MTEICTAIFGLLFCNSLFPGVPPPAPFPVSGSSLFPVFSRPVFYVCLSLPHPRKYSSAPPSFQSHLIQHPASLVPGASDRCFRCLSEATAVSLLTLLVQLHGASQSGPALFSLAQTNLLGNGHLTVPPEH